MSSLNKIMLIGHLGKDPEMRYSPTGAAMARITVATSENWKDKTTGEKQERTEWHNVVFFGALAEVVGKFLKKGSQVFVEGRIQTRKWQDKTTGQDRYSTEVVATEMRMLGRRGDSAKDSASSFDETYSEYQPVPAASPSAPTPAPRSAGEDIDLEKDVPF